jgi:predicted nuclease of predicted toxin-antitoxin system
MKLLIDMNLPPLWVRFLREAGFEALHWSTIGDPRATDATIMDWARHAGCVVFTHDLDFSALLAATEATGPSVIQA